MIGQRALQDKITGQIIKDRFPRFSILIGEKGSGKKMLAREISHQMFANFVVSDIKVEAIRNIIELSYKVNEKTVYIIPDCDNMSGASANALLKVTEEPPKNAYFILTCENEENLLPTIRSRGVTYMLEPYTYEDKCDYLKSYFWHLEESLIEFILEIASNMGELNYLVDLDMSEFQDYVNLVVDNIAEVSGSNAFKIGEKIALKDEEDKYDIRVFWKAFRSVCVDRMTKDEDPIKYANAIAITGDCLSELNIRGVNKQMLFDKWLLSIREAWL